MPLPRRLPLAGLAVMLLAATACTRASNGTGLRLGAPVPGTPVPRAIQFQDCTDRLLAVGVTVPKPLRGTVRIGCGTLQVPLDYAHPSGRSISLEVLRLHTSQNTTRPVRSLLFNPGGPGASGINLGVGLYAELPAAIARAYDFVIFDPRGVGLSAPVRCLTDRQTDQLGAQTTDVTTRAGLAQAKRLDLQYEQRCRAALGGNLRFYNTVATARDMDQIRQAVGDDRLNYLGYSYGTELGWTYAHLFPRQVRTVVLDGAVDPTMSAAAQALQQLKGFEDAFGQFAAHCRATSCLGRDDPHAAVAQIFAEARSRPLPTGSSRVLTESLAGTG
ncbi:MAG: alpha/beta fold hydrolase, partial [Jatrophihabitantaceae bacterium]